MGKDHRIPTNAEHLLRNKLDRLEQQVVKLKSRLRTPTMPRHDPEFPLDSVDGAHGLRDGDPWYFWDGAWHRFQNPGELILVGTYPTDPGTVALSPPFQHGWANVGGDYPPLAFARNGEKYVRIQGTCDGGVEGTVVFTLPPGYRPDESQRFPGSVASGSDVSTWQVDPTGDVTLIARGYNPGTGGLSEGTIAAGADGTVLTSVAGVATWEPPPAWLVGTGAPAVGLGVDGDMYLNTSNGDFYKRAAGAWTLQGNLTGPAGPTGATGAAGSQWRTGTTVPGSGLGFDGDMYLRTTTGDVYQKLAGSWGAVLENIVGPAGPAGATGPAGASGQVWDGQTFGRENESSSLNSPGLNGTNNTIYATLMRGKVPAGTVLSHIAVSVTGAASGAAAPTYLGICDSTGLILAATADCSSVMTAVGIVHADFVAAWTAAADTLLYFVWLQVGHWGTTSPSFVGHTSALPGNDENNLNSVTGLLKQSYHSAGTGVTWPSSLVAGNTLDLVGIGGSGTVFWGYVW